MRLLISTQRKQQQTGQGPTPTITIQMNHVNNNRRFGVQRITDAEASSSAMNYRCCYAIRPLKKTWWQTNYGCWCDIAASDKTDALACNELRMLMRHRTGRQNRHRGMQRITAAAARSCHQTRQTRWHATNYGCWPDQAERRHCGRAQVQCMCSQTQASVAICFQPQNSACFTLHRHNRPSDATVAAK